MRAAKLMPIATIFSSQAVLLCNTAKKELPFIEVIKTRISGFITAQRFVLCTYNAPRSQLSELIKITPGKKAPTLSPLEDDEWIGVSALVESSNVVQIMDSLTARGATDIIIFQISNSRVGA
jgi:ATP phosphoribosyltransferase